MSDDHAPFRDRRSRPLVAVTGLGVLTSAGRGREDTWAALAAGRSGIRRITRFPVDHLKTTIAGGVDLPEDAAGEPLPAAVAPDRVDRAVESLLRDGLVRRVPGGLSLG